MGRRKGRVRRKERWIADGELPKSAGPPFYRRLSDLLDEHDFDSFAEGPHEKSYAAGLGRPSLTPGVRFRSLRIGYLEGVDSECGVAWRIADSLSLRRFLSIALDEQTPGHSTISRTLRLLAREGLVAGGTIGVDATTLEANAALPAVFGRPAAKTHDSAGAPVAMSTLLAA